MMVILGILFTMGMVFGGYSLAGGKFGLILKALPFEFMMIGGSAVGAFLMTNQGPVAKATLKSMGKLIKGSKWKKQDYVDLLGLHFILLSTIKTKGMLAVEPHIEDAHASDIFSKYPKIQADHFACDFICDSLRLVSMNLDDPGQVKELMNKILSKHHHEAQGPSHALHGMADGLPALGIVAAVLGVIKTMASISEPPEVLGLMIGGALVGTFLGVFLAYALVGPMAGRLHQIADEEYQFYCITRDVIISQLQKNAPQVSVEIGRGSIPTHLQPSFAELEEAMEAAKNS